VLSASKKRGKRAEVMLPKRKEKIKKGKTSISKNGDFNLLRIEKREK